MISTSSCEEAHRGAHPGRARRRSSAVDEAGHQAWQGEELATARKMPASMEYTVAAITRSLGVSRATVDRHLESGRGGGRS